jgi:hypothetical protein
MDAAKGRPATESTTALTINPASVAVDGNRDTNWMHGSCTHTNFGDYSPWWRVDLQRVLYIITVRMLNRGLDNTGGGTCFISYDNISNNENDRIYIALYPCDSAAQSA